MPISTALSATSEPKDHESEDRPQRVETHVSQRTVTTGDRTLVKLIEGKNLSYWDNRLVASLEPLSIAARREDPFVCGSLFFKDWHLISSPALRGPRGWRYLPKSFKLRVFNTEKDPLELSRFDLFIIDYYTRRKFAKAISELQNLNIETRHKFIGSAVENEALSMDPETLEQLRKIGYIR